MMFRAIFEEAGNCGAYAPSLEGLFTPPALTRQLKTAQEILSELDWAAAQVTRDRLRHAHGILTPQAGNRRAGGRLL